MSRTWITPLQARTSGSTIVAFSLKATFGKDAVTSIVCPSSNVKRVPSSKSSSKKRSGTRWYKRMDRRILTFSGSSNSSTTACSNASKALSDGAKHVNGPGHKKISDNPASSINATNTDNCGFTRAISSTFGSQSAPSSCKRRLTEERKSSNGQMSGNISMSSQWYEAKGRWHSNSKQMNQYNDVCLMSRLQSYLVAIKYHQ